jgi:hypothetical protein
MSCTSSTTLSCSSRWRGRLRVAGGASAGGGACWLGAIFGDYFENKIRKKREDK